VVDVFTASLVHPMSTARHERATMAVEWELVKANGAVNIEIERHEEIWCGVVVSCEFIFCWLCDFRFLSLKPGRLTRIAP